MDRRTPRRCKRASTSPDRLRPVALVGVVCLLLLAALTPAANGVEYDGPWRWPFGSPSEVRRGFEPPATEWGEGHRGTDLPGGLGHGVVAIGDGSVSFAGTLAGRGVVVVVHGALRSTYEPVVPLVKPGDQVSAGEVLGLLDVVGSHCLPEACLHLGVIRGDEYLDPLTLLGPGRVRLLPLGPHRPDGDRVPRPPPAQAWAGRSEGGAVGWAAGSLAMLVPRLGLGGRD